MLHAAVQESESTHVEIARSACDDADVRAVLQRADGARVVVGDDVVSSFDGPGLVVLVGVTHGDTVEHARRLAAKVHDLRVFEPRHSAVPDPLDDGRRECSATGVFGADMRIELTNDGPMTLVLDVE